MGSLAEWKGQWPGSPVLHLVLAFFMGAVQMFRVSVTAVGYF